MVVDLVTIHHEAGAGKPPTDDVWRFAHGGYTFGVGNTIKARFRSVVDSYATLNYNGVSLDICLSSDHHTVNATTPQHVALIHDCYMEAFNDGEVTADPLVRDHQSSPGSATACSGNFTRAVWNDVVNACRPGGAPPQPKPPEDEAMDLASAINHDGRPVIVQVGGDDRLYMKIREVNSGAWRDWQDLSGGKTGFATCTAFVNPGARPTIEVFVTMLDGHTFHKWQTGDDYATWSDWHDETR
jgi:hypothetical protein